MKNLVVPLLCFLLFTCADVHAQTYAQYTRAADLNEGIYLDFSQYATN